MKRCIKSIVSIIIALTMLIPTALPILADTSYGFVDFPTGWSAPAMAHAVENGLMYGKSSDRIAPQDNLTRAEMATIINRAFGATVTKDISAFSDVSESQWYYSDIQKAYNMQTLYGDEGGIMRPDAFIIREEAIAIVARAMVLSGYDASNLDKFNDKAEIADWALDPIASMVANGYVNGDEKSNMNPKAFITREEFVQLLHNIVKHYYDAEDGVTTFDGNVMVNEPTTLLSDLVVNGDLILGDGVGTSTIVLKNVRVTGRILIRGAKHISFEKCSFGGGVTVKNVNDVVHFDHFSDEVHFNNMEDHTEVTFKKKTFGGGGVGPIVPTPTTANYTVEHYQEALDGSFSVFETETLSGTVGSFVTATAKTYEGFTEDTAYLLRVPTGTIVSDNSLVLKLYYTRNSYTVTFDFGSGAVIDPSVATSKTDKYGATVVLPTTGFSNDPLNFAGWFTEPNGAGTQVTQVTIGTADITVYAYWTPDNTYKVEHHKENLDGTYSIDSAATEILTADPSATVTATPKNYTGFSENTSHPERVASGTVETDNSLVLKLYYQRDRYIITFDPQGGTISSTPQTVFKYEESLVLPNVTKGSAPFLGWYTGMNGTGTKVEAGDLPEDALTVGANTLYAHWDSSAPDTVTFTVEHYKQELDGTYPAAASETEQKSATVGATVTAAVYGKTTYIGFTVDLAASTDVTVNADGTTVLKIYYTRNTYTFTFDYQGATGGNSELSQSYKYDQDFNLPVPTKGEEFGFGGWFTEPNGAGDKIEDKSALETTITQGNTILYAYWIQKYAYTVKYLQQNAEDDDYTVVLEDTEIFYGFDGDGVTVTNNKSYEGFTYDASSVTTGTVSSVTPLVIELKFNRNIYDVTYDYTEAGGQNVVPLRYGQIISLVAPSVTPPANKRFAGWNDASGNLIDRSLTVPVGGITIYAKWSQVFTVTFKEAGKTRHQYTIDPAVGSTVPQSEIQIASDALKAPFSEGYRKNASISSVYASMNFVNQIAGDWYYVDDSNNNVKFTAQTVVDRDLTVRYEFRKAKLELGVEKISQIIDPVLEVPFAQDTRFIDSLKDALFLNQEKLLLAFDQLNAQDRFTTLNTKIVEILKDKGFEVTPGRIFADDGEILKQHIEFNAFAYIDEAKLKEIVVDAVKTTFKNDPLRLRGIIDEMMAEQDKDVVDLMDTMLVSMLSGSDSARIKGIIADAVEKEVANDTTGEFKQKIKDIIVSQLNAGNTTVETSVKNAINDYFMNDANDAKIREIVTDLIDDAYATDDDADPVRAFVKDYIKTYFNENPTVLDDMIREMGVTLDPNDPNDAHIIELIEEVLDTNIVYLEKLVDEAIENLHNTVGEPVYDFIVDAIETELSTNDAELDMLIDEIANANVDDLKSVLKTVMEDKGTFKTVVEDAIEDEDVFKKVIKSALDNTDVFETIVRDLYNTDEEFYKMLVDIALSSTTLANTVKDSVVNDDDALVTVLKEVASDATLKAEMVDEILVAADGELKNQLTSPISSTSDYYADVKAKALDQAETEIINIIETGINAVDHPDYWPFAFEKAMEVAAANVREDLIEIGVDPNGSLWASAYADAMAQAEIDVTAELNGGITDASPYYHVAINGAKAQAETEITDLLATGIAVGSKYWQTAYDTAKAILKEEIETNFNDKIDELKADGNLNQVKVWAQGSLDKPEVETVIEDLLKGLATSTEPEDVNLKETILDKVIDTVNNANEADKEILVDDIITELLKPANDSIKDAVAAKAIEVLNLDTNALIKAEVVDGVLDDILGDATLKADLIADLKVKVKDPANAALKETVIDEAINAVVNDSVVNIKAIEIINDLIEEDPAFKASTITHIVDYILEDEEAREEAMEKVVEMIEDPHDTSHKDEAIEFAFDVLKGDTTTRAEVVDKFLTSILSDTTKRQDMATEVIDIMFANATLRDRILDLGFEQMFSNSDTIKKIVELALDELIADDEVRREMILAVIETDSGRDSILDILFEELERDSTFLDKMIDIAMKGKYGDMVDKFAYDLVNSGVIEINPDNRQIAEEIVLPMLDDITLDTVMERLPERITEVLPQGRIEQIFNKFKLKVRELLVEGIEEAKKGNSKAVPIMIDNDIDIVNEILIPAYNKVFPKVQDKAEDFYYYNENAYIKAIVDMLDPAYLLDNTKPASSFGTGYRLKDAKFYYELMRNTFVLADDAGDWYLNNLTDEQIDKAIAKFESAYNKYLTKLNNFVGNKIPKDKLDTVIDYAKKAIDKREAVYDGTTTGAFERLDTLYDKIISFVKEKVGADISTDTVIEITFDGSNLIVNGDGKVNIDDYDISVSVKGYTFKLDSHSIIVGGKTVDISGYVQKIADKFGTRSVTIKFAEIAPYAYSVHVGNNSVKLSAIYE